VVLINDSFSVFIEIYLSVSKVRPTQQIKTPGCRQQSTRRNVNERNMCWDKGDL